MQQNIETLLINKNNIPASTPKPSKMQQDKDTADGVLLGVLLYDATRSTTILQIWKFIEKWSKSKFKHTTI